MYMFNFSQKYIEFVFKSLHEQAQIFNFPLYLIRCLHATIQYSHVFKASFKKNILKVKYIRDFKFWTKAVGSTFFFGYFDT